MAVEEETETRAGQDRIKASWRCKPNLASRSKKAALPGLGDWNYASTSSWKWAPPLVGTGASALCLRLCHWCTTQHCWMEKEDFRVSSQFQVLFLTAVLLCTTGPAGYHHGLSSESGNWLQMAASSQAWSCSHRCGAWAPLSLTALVSASNCPWPSWVSQTAALGHRLPCSEPVMKVTLQFAYLHAALAAPPCTGWWWTAPSQPATALLANKVGDEEIRRQLYLSHIPEAVSFWHQRYQDKFSITGSCSNQTCVGGGRWKI